MTKRTLPPKTGKCIICGNVCYLECQTCYAVVLYPGQPHRCPEKVKIPSIVEPVLYEKCS